DERFATNAARVQHRPALVQALGALLAAGDADTWVARLVDVGVPAGKVGTVAEGFALAADLGLDPLVDVGPGVPAQVRHPITYSDTPVTEYTAPPRLGEHSDAVRRWLQEENRGGVKSTACSSRHPIRLTRQLSTSC